MNANSFSRNEWELLGAYVYGFQKMPSEFYDDGHTYRPWLPMERIEMAFKAMEAKKIQFKLTRYNKDENKFVTFSEPPSNEVRECKRLFDGIMDWNKAVLSECFDRAQKLCETVGFERHEPAPSVLQKPKGVMDIDDLMKESKVPTKTVEVPKTVVVARPVEETAVDSGHAETLATGEVVEQLNPQEKARVAEEAKKLVGGAFEQPVKRGPGRPVKVPKI